MIAPAREESKKIPRAIKIFLLKGAIVFVAWQLLYQFILKPIRQPDKFLTDLTGYAVQKVITLFYHPTDISILINRIVLSIDNRKILGIADPCNALEIYVLYIGFLFCYPADNKRRWIYTLIGIPVILLVNIIRCSLLIWLNINHRGWFDVSHHYLFTAAVYLVVFYMWMLFTKNTNANVHKS